jgi:hypothetical protein
MVKRITTFVANRNEHGADSKQHPDGLAFISGINGGMRGVAGGSPRVVLGSAAFRTYLPRAGHAGYVIRIPLRHLPLSSSVGLWGLLLGILFLSACSGVHAASTDSLYLERIEISGAQRTRRAVVLRELMFREGETVRLSDIPMLAAESRRLLLNTGMFIQVEVDPCRVQGDTMHICVQVVEAWYFFPVILFDLADRNFNVWWQDFDASLDRLNVGFYLNHLNFLGYRDQLKVKFQYGYTRKHEFAYEMGQLPGLPNWGAGVRVNYLRNRELQYSTQSDRQQFFRDDERFLLRRTGVMGYLSYRPAKVWQHRVTMGFRHIRTPRSVIEELNANLFRPGRRSARFLHLSYETYLDRLVDAPYPFRGYAFTAEVRKEGLGVFRERDRGWVQLNSHLYLPTGDTHGFEYILRGRAHFIRTNEGFFEYTALGYGPDALRGYERYVIDGMDFAMVKIGWRATLFDRRFPLPFPRWAMLDKVRVLPLQVYGNVYSDHGYVHRPFFQEGNRLHDRLLSSVGVGLDFRIYFDKVFSVMWSFNQLGENGLFLHTKLRI